MNIPQNIILNRKIISSDVYKYHQSLAKRLNQNKKYQEYLHSKKISSYYKKEKILKWFTNLNTQNRIKVCLIYNNWLTKIIFQMSTYVDYDCVVEFYPTEVYEEFLKNKKTDLTKINESYIKDRYCNVCYDFENEQNDNFKKYFRGENNVKKSSGAISSKQLSEIDYKNHREKEFIHEIRILSLNEFNDSLTMSLELIKKPEKMIEYFNYFSKDKCFSSIITPFHDKNKNYNFSLPDWAYEYECYSIHQLLIIFFEQIISIYYQLFLVENEIPSFDIDEKICELLKMNSNIEEYLYKKYNDNTNVNKFDFIDKQKIFTKINEPEQKKLIQYYEGKTEMVFSYIFNSSINEPYYNENSKKREFEKTINDLIKIFQKNVNFFVYKISFIELKDAFLYVNFIYSILYQQLVEQCSIHYYNELLIEEEEKNINNKNIKNKNKKNKKRKNKKNKNNEKEKILNNNMNNINIGNNIDNENNINIIDDEITNIEEEKEKNNKENEEEEIEEIPSDIVIEPKVETKEGELNNNIVASNNDINNSTVSSSYTNKCSKDYCNYGPKYNNFFRGDKKEEEMLIEIKDLSEEQNDDKSEEKDEKIKVEDISENEVSEEIIVNEDIYININQNDKNDKNKKKNKKRNRRKKLKNKNNINNIDINQSDNLNIEKNKNIINNSEEKVKNNNIEKINLNKEIIENKNGQQNKEKLIKEKNEPIKIDKEQNKEEINISKNINNINNIKNIENVKKQNKEGEEKINNKNKCEKDKINEKEKQEKEEKKEEKININEEKIINEIKNDEKKEHNQQIEKNSKKKKNKEFFLFPVCHTNKKKGNKKETKKKENTINDININNSKDKIPIPTSNEKEIKNKNQVINNGKNNKKENSTQTDDLSNSENKNEIILSNIDNNNKTNTNILIT